MVFHEGPIEGLVVRPLTRHEDARGWLIELFRCDELPPELSDLPEGAATEPATTP